MRVGTSDAALRGNEESVIWVPKFLPSPPSDIDTTTSTSIIKMKFTAVTSVLVLLAGYVSAQGASSFTQPVETTLDEPSATPTLPGGTTAESSLIVDPTVGSSSIDTELPITESTDSVVTIQTSLPGTDSTSLISVSSTPLTTASVTRSTLLSASVTSTSSAPNQSQTGNSAAGITGNGVAVGAFGLALGLML
ncbi:hypothetical protein AB1N83_008793 [Pleurotus pulmonarius]